MSLARHKFLLLFLFLLGSLIYFPFASGRGTNVRTIPSRFDFVYYSFATMTALGPAGIVPISDHARSVSIIEALVGLLYLAVLISRLMASYHGNSDHRRA